MDRWREAHVRISGWVHGQHSCSDPALPVTLDHDPAVAHPTESLGPK